VLAYLTALTLLCAAVFAVAGPSQAETPAETDGGQEPSSARLDAMIRHLVELAPRHPANREGYRETLVDAISEAAPRHDLPVELVTAICFRESSMRRDVTGPAGELGVMQVHPSTAVRFRCRLETVADQVDCGCKILAHHRDRCDGDLRGALAAYGSRSGSCSPPAGGSVSRMVSDRFALADELRGL
jgi:hypothetical protein